MASINGVPDFQRVIKQHIDHWRVGEIERLVEKFSDDLRAKLTEAAVGMTIEIEDYYEIEKNNSHVSVRLILPK